MTNQNEIFKKLLEKLELLSQKQDAFSNEINTLREEIHQLQVQSLKEQSEAIHVTPPLPVYRDVANVPTDPIQTIDPAEQTGSNISGPPEIPTALASTTPKAKADYEHFIGSNIINKIGIAITIIGVAIGAKYSIDHELISPITRILLGYVVGLGLLGFGFKLKKAYPEYSSVLVSGAIAIMYFITYAAFSFYHLFPQTVAFALMVLFTVLTVMVALNYNRQVIAHIGLVGAYAVPFLLSNDAGNIVVFYTYVAIINIGILIIAVRKYWKPLYYSSFILTWLIFGYWYFLQYEDSSQYMVFWIFAFIFFSTFYLIFIAYKVVHQEKFMATDVLLILSNSFIFYGLGYAALTNHDGGDHFRGLFTIAIASVHLCVALFIYSRTSTDRNLLTMIAGLVLVFITIAVPVQLDGSWVTLLWAGEAALLYWIGHMRKDQVYENISYALVFLAFFSILGDWLTIYNLYDYNTEGTRITPLFNIHFLTSLLFMASFAFMTYINKDRADDPPAATGASLRPMMVVVIPFILLLTTYFTFRIEISSYFDQLYLDSSTTTSLQGTDYPTTYYNEDLAAFKVIWILNYSVLFSALLTIVNLKIIKNQRLAIAAFIFSSICIITFLVQGLPVLNQLRDSFMHQDIADPYLAGRFNIMIRYISFAFVGLLLLSMYSALQKELPGIRQQRMDVSFDLLLHLTILSVLSNEWITWMSVLGYSVSTTLGLSIVWGIYALTLIILGIWKGKRHLRIMAITLFALTLFKLFFYDLSHLNTIAKTVVFVSLGILLLIISFLYNKYKHVTDVRA